MTKLLDSDWPSRKQCCPSFIRAFLTLCGLIPLGSGYFFGHNKHHQVIGSGIKLDEQMVGGEAEVIDIGHTGTHQGESGVAFEP